MPDVQYAGRVQIPPRAPVRDEVTGVLNPGGIREVGLRLAERVRWLPAVGMDITIYNPELDDADRSAGRALARAVTTAFARSGRW